MVRPRCPQRSLAEMWFRDSVDDCWQPWMRQAEELLDDPQLVEPVYEALGRPLAAEPPAGPGGHPSGSRLAAVGVEARPQLELRCAALQREVKANLVYRLFTRSGAEKVPAAKTLAKIALALGPQVIGQIHQRLLAMAQEKQAVPGKKLRLDTTVVETNMHDPTDHRLPGRRPEAPRCRSVAAADRGS